jgi:hypothetical protein
MDELEKLVRNLEKGMSIEDACADVETKPLLKVDKVLAKQVAAIKANASEIRTRVRLLKIKLGM